MSEPGRNDEMRAAVREILRELVPAAADGPRNGHEHSNGNGHSNGKRPSSVDELTVVPQVPAPPVPAVMRPSTWNQPPAPGEVIGNSSPAPAPAPGRSPAPAAKPSPRSQSLRAAFTDSEFRPTAPGAPPPLPGPASTSAQAPGSANSGDERLEVVTLDSDEDLEQFIRQLMSRLENPRERLAIRTGRLRFRLRRAAGSAPGGVAPGGSDAAPVTRVQRGAVTERMIRAAAAEGTRLVLAPGAVLTPLAREQARARGVEIERERRC
jgi:hypothetical protein